MKKIHAALFALSLPLAAPAQHFSQVFVDVRLHARDSVTVGVEADLQDMMNTVFVFPLFGGDTSAAVYRLYENKLEAYLQQRVRLSADGKPVSLRAVAWKADGKDRDDRMDSVSIRRGNHTIVLGGKLPAGTRRAGLYSEMWVERPENVRPSIQYNLFKGDTLLRTIWSLNEKTVRFPVSADSVASMLRSPPPPLPRRVPMDHSGHDD
jgi:hypothetical protein